MRFQLSAIHNVMAAAVRLNATFEVIFVVENLSHVNHTNYNKYARMLRWNDHACTWSESVTVSTQHIFYLGPCPAIQQQKGPDYCTSFQRLES